jgi:hypothetical protein
MRRLEGWWARIPEAALRGGDKEHRGPIQHQPLKVDGNEKRRGSGRTW